jgi:O-antigen ligase
MNHIAKTRPWLWVVLLVFTALIAQTVVSTHLARVRGLPAGFPTPVPDANVPSLGVNAALEQYDDDELDAALAHMSAGGITWVRQSFYWSQIAAGEGRYDWSVADRLLTAMSRHPQLRLVAVLDDDPPVPPTDPDQFATFAGAFARRYGAQVDHYQVWDEPNLAEHWGGSRADPSAYADLLARSADAVRAADADARIMLAGLAPTTESGPQNLSEVRYLDQLYRTGAAPYFEIVAGKPYGFDTGPDDRRAGETVLNFSRLILLREVMERNGDADKAIWASHWGWNALPPGWTGSPSIWGQTDEETQAARTVAALERARAEWPWCGALILENYQPLAPDTDARWGFALVGQGGDLRPAYHAAADWAAALPDAAPPGGYSARNAWVSYEGDWRLGPLGADVGTDGDRAVFCFDGPSVALTVRRGPYLGFLYVTVDGQPANALPLDEAGRAYVVLYDDEPSMATAPLATDLGPGEHTVEVVADGGQGHWALVDWRAGVEPVRDGFAWKVGGLALAALGLLALLVRDARRFDWAALERAFRVWPQWAQILLAVALAGLLWIVAAAGWGQGWDNPWLVASLLSLPALAMLFAQRPDLGLALTALTAPFYLCPASMFYRGLSLPEVLVLLCGVGMIIQRLGKDRAQEKASLVDAAVLLLLLAAVAASMAAADRWAALFELKAVFLLPSLYYVLLRIAPLKGWAKWQVADGLVLGGFAMAGVGLVQYVLGINVVVAEGGLPRLQGVYPSPNNVGLYLGRVWPLLLAVALWAEKGRRRLLYRLALVPVLLALLLSFSRGALLLGVPAALLAMGWRAGGHWRWVALTLVVVATVALVPLLSVPRFASLLDLEQGGTFFRLELWRSTLALIRDRPWFGAGPGNFLEAYRTRYILPSAWQEFNLEHPHNVYLDHWTRLGVLGVLAGIGGQFAFWREMRRRPGRDILALGFVGCMVVLLAHGLVDNTLFFPDLAFTFFLLLGLAQGGGISILRRE